MYNVIHIENIWERIKYSYSKVPISHSLHCFPLPAGSSPAQLEAPVSITHKQTRLHDGFLPLTQRGSERLAA